MLIITLLFISSTWLVLKFSFFLQLKLAVEVPPAVCDDCYKRVMNEFMKQAKVRPCFCLAFFFFFFLSLGFGNLYFYKIELELKEKISSEKECLVSMSY